MTKANKRWRLRDRRRRGRNGAILNLNLKPNSKSGYNGDIPNDKGWRVLVCKETKKPWDSIGTYTTAQEAANRLLLWLLISGNDTRVKILHIRNNFTP